MKRTLLLITLTLLLAACGAPPQTDVVDPPTEIEPIVDETEVTEIEPVVDEAEVTEIEPVTDETEVTETEPVQETEPIEEPIEAETTTASPDSWTEAWMVNETGKTSGIFSNTLVNVESVTIEEINGQQYQRIRASGIPDYETTITQQLIELLNSRPKADTDFANGSTPLQVGDVVAFGEDIGFVAPMGCSPGNEGSGYWPLGPACPQAQNKDQLFPLNPEPTTDVCFTGLSDIGTWVNGVAIFNWQDGQSYNRERVWNNEAFHFEFHDLDIDPGHSANGNYHHHSNPVSLGEQLGDDGSAHSPIYGFAADGYPIYGPWHASGELANSCWKTRNYDDPESPTGCGVAGERSCFLVDQYDISQGTEPAPSNGPSTMDVVTSLSGNPFVTTSGYYFEDYYYDPSCSAQGVAYLDEHNGHDHDGLGYHYHVTIAEEADGTHVDAFPFYVGPTYAGVLQDNAIAQCSSGGGAAPPPPGGGQGGGQGRGGGPPDFAAIAEVLGITEDQLREAIGGPPPNFEAASEALGIPAEDIEAAFAANR